ncbi:unnamed protein product [Periconia digitata]|uniref:Uncharacterized protein n=1 Tax=Periconia digitata TaxID=1303443 RepID=A0A9W4U991_9PLEO|nr:unnamed protein product [Periconia digitata]
MNCPQTAMPAQIPVHLLLALPGSGQTHCCRAINPLAPSTLSVGTAALGSTIDMSILLSHPPRVAWLEMLSYVRQRFFFSFLSFFLHVSSLHHLRTNLRS